MDGLQEKNTVRTTIVIPTTLSKEVFYLLGNLYGNIDDTFQIYFVIDGACHQTDETDELIAFYKTKFRQKNINLYKIIIPHSVGAGGYYSHRSIAGFCHLVNTEFVTFIDQDNMISPYHFIDLIDRLDKYKDLPFAYSYRTIIDKNGVTVCRDECESLGWQPIMGEERNGYLIDTSCWFYRTSFIKRYGHLWHNKWGADRRFTGIIRQVIADSSIMEYACTKTHSLLYRLGGNPGSVTANFFLEGNELAQHRVDMNIW